MDKRLPPWTLYRWLQSSFLLASLSAMLQSGMTLQAAVSDMAKTASPWQRSHYRKMLAHLSRGLTEVQSLDTQFLPDELSDRLMIYATLPSFPAVMRSLSKDAVRIFEKKIDSAVGIVKNTIMLTVAAFILFTIFSMGEIAFTLDQATSKATSAATR